MKIQVSAPRDVLVQFVIYDHPLDRPDAWVVRAWFIRAGKLAANPVAWSFPSLAAARDAIPEGMFRIPRHPEDDSVVAEVWT